jgi:hypothetical protein
MAESISSSNSHLSSLINNAVESASTSTTSTTTTTSISMTTEAELQALNIDTTNITTEVEAKKAIEKAQEKKALEEGQTSSSSQEIKDTVDISQTATNALNNLITGSTEE